MIFPPMPVVVTPARMHLRIRLTRTPFTATPENTAKYREWVTKFLGLVGTRLRTQIAKVMTEVFSVSGGASPSPGKYVIKGRDTKSVTQYMSYWGQTVSENRLVVYLKPEYKYLFYQEVGVFPHKMTYFLGKIVPFVIVGGKWMYAGPGSPWAGQRGSAIQEVESRGALGPLTYHVGQTDEGKRLFRSVTHACFSGDQKSWRHPGYDGKFFFRDTILRDAQPIGKMMAKQVSNQIFGAQTRDMPDVLLEVSVAE